MNFLKVLKVFETYKICKVFREYWSFLVVSLLSLVFFYPVFGLYFAQDDFFHLKMSRVGGLGEFFSFFAFKSDYGYTFYRPLTTQVYNFLVSGIFGLEPFFFHLVAFIF